MIVNFNGKILTILDPLAEDDAFIYSAKYPEWIKTFFTKRCSSTGRTSDFDSDNRGSSPCASSNKQMHITIIIDMGS